MRGREGSLRNIKLLVPYFSPLRDGDENVPKTHDYARFKMGVSRKACHGCEKIYVVGISKTLCIFVVQLPNVKVLLPTI